VRVLVQNAEDRLHSDLLRHSRDFLFDHLIRSLPIRGKQRFLSWLLPGAGETQALLHGLPYFRVDFSDWIQRCIYLGTYEQPESRWVRSVLRPGDTCIDVGANCGFYTSLFWSVVKPSGAVLAFEPNPTLYGRLTNWFKANGIPGVETYPAALGDQEGTAKVHLPPPTARNNNSTMTPKAGSRSVDVNIWQLGDILRSRKLEKVRLSEDRCRRL
jgi:FkbM family methyltransferase